MQLPFDFTGVYNQEIASSLKRDFGLLNTVECVKDYGDFGNWANGISPYDMAMGL